MSLYTRRSVLQLMGKGTAASLLLARFNYQTAADPEATKTSPPQNNHLGITVNIPEILPFVFGTRAGRVSIHEDQWFPEKNCPSLVVLQKAKALDLYTSLTYNPHQYRSPEQYVQDLEHLLPYCNEVVIGNEMEHTKTIYYQVVNHDTGELASDQSARAIFDDYAMLFRNGLEQIGKMSPGTKVVCGSVWQPPSFPSLMQSMRDTGLNVNHLTVAAHSYQTPQSIRDAVKWIRSATDAEIILHEFGVQGPDKRILLQMYAEAEAQKVKYSYAYELLNNIDHQDLDQRGWGFLDKYVDQTTGEVSFIPNQNYPYLALCTEVIPLKRRGLTPY